MTLLVHANWVIKYQPLPRGSFWGVCVCVCKSEYGKWKNFLQISWFGDKKSGLLFVQPALISLCFFYCLKVRRTVRCWMNFSFWYWKFYKFKERWVSMAIIIVNFTVSVYYKCFSLYVLQMKFMTFLDIMPSLQKNSEKFLFYNYLKFSPFWFPFSLPPYVRH